MRVAACQLDIVWENKSANHEKIRGMLDAAKLPAGTLFILPEMFSTGFSMDIPRIAEAAARESENFVAKLAQEHGLFVMAGVVNAGVEGKGRNQCVVYSPQGREIARYSKLQPFALAGEMDHYVPGNEIVTFQCQDFLIAPFICYDLRFPEIFRVAAKRAPHLITVIANWPVKRIHHWTALLKARAIENQAFVVGVNRCGNDPKFEHNGRSLIVDYHGQVIAEAGSAEEILTAELDMDALQKYRTEFPALKDMRSDFVR